MACCQCEAYLPIVKSARSAPALVNRFTGLTDFTQHCSNKQPQHRQIWAATLHRGVGTVQAAEALNCAPCSSINRLTDAHHMHCALVLVLKRPGTQRRDAVRLGHVSARIRDVSTLLGQQRQYLANTRAGLGAGQRNTPGQDQPRSLALLCLPHLCCRLGVRSNPSAQRLNALRQGHVGASVRDIPVLQGQQRQYLHAVLAVNLCSQTGVLADNILMLCCAR